MLVYIAAPFFRKDELEFVMSIERTLDDAGIAYISPRIAGDLGKMSKEESHLYKGAIFAGNIRDMQTCTHVVAVIDGRDTGTMWEMGYCYASMKPIVSITNNDYGINIMLSESVKAHVKGTSKLVEALEYDHFIGEIIDTVV